jgi:rabenosyn-5
MDAFAQFDTAARRIRDMPTESEQQKKLQKAVYMQAYQFLSLHMLPLKSLPKVLRHAAPNGHARPNGAMPNGKSYSSGDIRNGPNGRQMLAAIHKHGSTPSVTSLTPSVTPSIASSATISALETEEKELRERLIVLEEQKFFVSEMLADASKHRRFDEVESLKANVLELGKEVDEIRGQLGQVERGFVGVYSGVGEGIG